MKITKATVAGFTLVEIMIVVAIISVLAGIAIPSFFRARKRSQCTRILQDLRIVDNAQDQYAIENNKMTGNPVGWTDIQQYIKNGTVPWFSNGCDLFGNPYNQGNGFSVDNVPKLNPLTYQMVSDVAPASFWSPYYP